MSVCNLGTKAMKHSMRMIASIVALIASASLSYGQTPRVDRAEVSKPGIYSAKVTKRIADKSISTGTRNEVGEIRNTEITTLIPAKVNMFFGLEGTVIGAPKGTGIPVRIVWRYPQPGLKNPAGGAAKLIDEYMDSAVIGKNFQFFWQLTRDWQIVPGVWTFEMWYQGRKLVSQNFTLVKG